MTSLKKNTDKEQAKIDKAAEKARLKRLSQYEAIRLEEEQARLAKLGLLWQGLIYKNDREGIQKMLAQGFDVNTSVMGSYALHWAAFRGNQDLCIELIRLGADVNNRSKETDSTALLDALENHHEACAYDLLAHGADPLAKNKVKLTTLHFAVRRGSEALVRRLIEQGVDKNAKDYNGNTPAHIAIRFKNEEATLLLYQLGANFKHKNTWGKPPGETPEHYSFLESILIKGFLKDKISPEEASTKASSETRRVLRM